MLTGWRCCERPINNRVCAALIGYVYGYGDVLDMVMTLEDVAETYPDLLYMDEFKEALMGVVERIGTVSLCYDQDKIIEILMRDMTEEEAIEHFHFNVVGGWVGEHTPFTFIGVDK